MCGICGAMGLPSRGEDDAAVRRMLAAIVHRGPDEEGIVAASNAVAGVRRLSIIDIPGGGQPIRNESGTLAVVFNGEIYNFRELRAQLESYGHRFQTRSDTETILHSYEQWGADCLPHLRGMFAFGIIEMPVGSAGEADGVFLARDPLGIKPLYYALASGAVLFASEVRALLASGHVSARLAGETIKSYLLFGSIGEPSTIIEGISSLPPGHFLRISASPPIRVGEPTPYWHPGLSASSRIANNGQHDVPRGDRPANAIHVRTLLQEAVRSHLVADVPVGVFLSGGIDSSVIATLAAAASSDIHTFTLAFPDAGFSEGARARSTAERLGTHHVELTLSASDMLARIEESVDAFDQPSMDGINTYFVSWAARQAGLKVALSGLGSDELFGGYRTFRTTSAMAHLGFYARFFPRFVRQAAHPLVGAVARLAIGPDASRKALSAWIDSAAFPHPYFFARALFTPHMLSSSLPLPSESTSVPPWFLWMREAAKEAVRADDFTAVSWLELRSYLANTLLRDTDAMSMSHSLEVRVPFLDSPLVEHVLSLPETMKYAPGRPKSLLLDAMGAALPHEIGSEPKRTFTFPWENWLRGPLRARVARGLSDWSPALQPYLGHEFAASVWRDFLAARTSWSRPWSLYVLNEWAKRNLRAADARFAESAGNPVGSVA